MIAQAQFTIADLSDTGIEVVVGTQTASTNAWRGNASFSELRDGQTILYWLPYAGNGSAVTLNLTLADGTETGAVKVYINTNPMFITDSGWKCCPDDVQEKHTDQRKRPVYRMVDQQEPGYDYELL